jgi:hypothetical protein
VNTHRAPSEDNATGKVNAVEIWDRFNGRGKFARGRGRRAA